MTFDEYNTDENFNKPSNAMELVRLGKEEGQTREEIANSLSPLWKEDKNGNIKKALDYHFNNNETAPKEEAVPKVEEMKQTTETLKEEDPKKTKNETTSDIKTKDKSFMESQNAIQDVAEDEEMKRQTELEQQRWDATSNRMKKSGEAFGNIDDKLIDQLPTFMWRRYQNGEFGDPKSSDAKLRLAYFAINNVASKLKMVANADAAARGQGTLFQNTESAYDQYQASNLAQGLENRWNKYKSETQAAIDLAKSEGADEQDLQSSIAKISSNNRLNTAFNMMNENQKVYTLQVLSKIGGEIGNMNNKDFVNTLIGFATSGENLTWQEAAELLVARFGKDALTAVKKANEEGATDGGKDSTAGIGGGIGNNLKGYQTIDGETVDFSMIADKDQKTKLRGMMDDLSNRYYNGEIDAETFKKYYEPLYGESKKHFGTGSKTADQLLEDNNKRKRGEINEALNELQSQAKSGNISPSDYKDQFDDILNNFKKWGLNEKDLKKVEKARLSSEKISKFVESANKKKK